MIAKALVATSLVAAPIFAATPQTDPQWEAASVPTEYQANTAAGVDPMLYPEIVRVDCDGSRGSAVKVGPRVLLSVAHVTDGDDCRIAGAPITVIGKTGDFSILLTNIVSDRWLRIDCGGFIKGRTYTGVGYARGLDSLTTVDTVAVGKTLWGFNRLNGVFTVIPGQSGGAFLDAETHAFVGMINVFEARRGDSGGVALRETPLCGGRA